MNTVARVIEPRLRSVLERHRSVLLLGPRQTGKTTLVRGLEPDVYLNFLDPGLRQRYEREPDLLAKELRGGEDAA